MSANGSNWEKITKAAVTIVTFGAAIPLRKKVLANALLRAQPEVEDFKTKTNPIVFVPLDKRGKAAVQNFATINKEAEHIHNTAVTEAKKMKVPVPGKVQSLSESQKQIDAIGAGLSEIIKTTNEKKALNSAAQHVAFHMAKDHLKKNALASGIAALPSIAIAADIGGITGGEGALGDIVPGDMIDATDILLGAAAFPGFLSGTKSLFKEFDMLSNGETTFDEALKNGILPAAGDVLLTSVTLGIDVALFSGIPVTTFLTNIFGLKCKKNSAPGSHSIRLGSFKTVLQTDKRSRKKSH